MIEVYTGSVGTIELITYEDGVPVEPDDTPTVTITDAEVGTDLESGNATILNSNYPGEYYFDLSAVITDHDRVLKVVWSYSIGGRSIEEVEYVYVSSPYATIDEIVSELGYSSRPEDPNYYPYEKIKSAERTARMIINDQLGYSMGKSLKTITAYGDGADVLRLPEKIIYYTNIYENDQLVIDTGSNYNIFGFDVESTETDYALRIVPPNPGDDISEQEVIDFTGFTSGRFRDGYRYEVTGVFGWNYIPVEIKQAMFLLVNDLVCNDIIGRSRYIKKMDNGQISIELSSLAFNGTGNALADSLINKFKMMQAVII